MFAPSSLCKLIEDFLVDGILGVPGDSNVVATSLLLFGFGQDGLGSLLSYGKRGRPGGSVIPTGSRVNTDKKRRARSEQLSPTLIVTPYIEHSAREPCESDRSWGPDTVSLSEELFCDMETRDLFYLYDEVAGVTTNCFNLATETLRLPQGGIPLPDIDIHARGLSVPKVYNYTSYW